MECRSSQQPVNWLFLVEGGRNVERLPCRHGTPHHSAAWENVYSEPFHRCGRDLRLIYSPAPCPLPLLITFDVPCQTAKWWRRVNTVDTRVCVCWCLHGCESKSSTFVCVNLHPRLPLADWVHLHCVHVFCVYLCAAGICLLLSVKFFFLFFFKIIFSHRASSCWHRYIYRDREIGLISRL